MSERPVVICFSAAGAAIAGRIAAFLGAEYLPHEMTARTSADQVRKILTRAWLEERCIIGVCAAGILIRLLKDSIGRKEIEPPLIAISTDGKHVVPLLGGHRGANRLARELAANLGATAAITTASETGIGVVLDDPPQGWVLAVGQDVKPFASKLLAGEKVRLVGPAPWLSEAGLVADDGAVAITVSEELPGDPSALHYHPMTLIAGVGCERGCDPAELIGLIETTLASHRLSPLSVAALATIELKSDEPAILGAAAHFGVPLRLFTAAELAAEHARLPNPSAIVEAEVGTPGVAEAAALKAGALLIEKRKSSRATCAVGRSPAPLEVEGLGRAVGALFVVGIGPGDPVSRTPEATAALKSATDWVGYGLYLDLAADLRAGQSLHPFPIGEEAARVKKALALAAAGHRVALVSSGDPGIYAMASLVFEEIEKTSARTAVTVIPGISALQSAAAKAGALLGHDFAAVSLSDLLTPRETILTRLEAAAAGDFVVALYNPRSGRRTGFIEQAKAIFLRHRPPATPVVVASNLGRNGESVRITTLTEFDPASVDMLTIVLIGSSQSRAFTRGSGATLAYTPRGYASKGEGSE
ncbi:MAG: precorrin-3B C(17)-methyltransferase [Cucumibacter sp.]